MRALGFDVKKKDVIKIMNDLGKDEGDKVDFKEFLDISTYIQCKRRCVHRDSGVNDRNAFSVVYDCLI